MSLKSTLDKLKPSDRARLMHAFENSFSQHVNLPDDRFIGVNVVGANFKVEEQAGVWSYGTIKRSS